ncbi:UDP-N-acetylmuramate:L-alanyl-gamma-D-glutamyl-meso-diaminopimelate ligase [Paraburkholderia caballeronis]|uniref:UDP-N-acetylmuramate--L-alanyl-gamma-D-glutamyl-meso-2,6-diaminoheptandioate ligase n=1 Tax=Paraburkholderia caballeronis TaxID=416943 RepID=A0A1H7PZP5_9BURK|nr:UDP-N-acetylmuramate:L-alanyl-gamma-D-glutamyl-meso-diaminopimelate ligase [Paraburkholderia caballeronis]PXW24411.1 UDP-N-acetylmuramate: L-alanyl-gamma-D-glutamyl-meso-diaminopimelate ligase [Paraburkholderia caballeronis]PXX00193.1 UDP-N-acetylmuramate: L-alanyl-gamma-D-glutamyl-meso-diaminopimelate ligase [Paraburkholderia caballeronis]RAJ97322.1 UDP-N-acetylmuramate: L-alanyl-gamma-D-glutamyl-meso-diaminopimelate ligase [Paraburkholderia caballeronis]TDV09846.1 UDP-N-acetylmuramate: L-a
MHIHILGICGTFMGGLAVLARSAGHTVTGCDAGVYPPMSTQLEAQGIRLIEGYDASQLDLKPDLFVIGNVVTRGNPLMEAILDRGLPYVSGPQWLGEHVLADKWVLAVAGTHGKTTTTSMLTWLLEDAGLNPGFLIGGVPLNFGVSARLTDSSFFVIEADEYDTAFFDKRSKFVHYRPRTAILNNLEFDHADIFPDLAAIETQFHHLVRTIAGVGRIVTNGRSDALERVLARGCWSEVERFGVDGGWLALPAESGVPVDERFAVYHDSERVGVVDWQIQGEHNRLNALAAIAAARHVGVPPAQAAQSLATFRNVKRRMEVRGSVDGVTVYDDFAHHPTAIDTTIAGLRARVGRDNTRILAVLEPRSNTMKLGVMKAQLPASLADADLVFGYGALHGRDALGWDLAAALAPLGAKAHAFHEIDALVKAVAAAAQPGDQVLVMSNGGFGGIHQKLLDALSARGVAAARSGT